MLTGFLALAAYAAYTVFGLRLLWHFSLWLRGSSPVFRAGSPGGRQWQTWPLATFDIVFFRRLLTASGLLWVGSWTFHVSFLIVVVSHLRYFTEPVPAMIGDMQTCGLISGYLLPASVVYLLIFRTFSKKDRYLTFDNYLILGMVLAIGVTGLLMRTVFRPDLVSIKGFAFGLLTFHPAGLHGSALFVVHFVLVLFLLLIVPSHIFSAPLVTIEARRREEALKQVMHDE